MRNTLLPIVAWLLLTEPVIGHDRDASVKGPLTVSDQDATLLAFSRDGSILAVVNGATIRLVDASTGKTRATLQAHIGRVTSLSFTADGSTLVSGSEDRTICFWNLPAATKRRQLNVGFPVFSVAFSADGKSLAVANAERVVLWDAKTQNRLRELTASAPCSGSLAFSPNGWHLVAGVAPPPVPKDEALGRQFPGTMAAPTSSNATLRIWDVATGKTFRNLEDSAGFIFSTVFAADGRLVAATTPDGRVAVWEVASGRKVLDDGQIRQPVQWMKFVAFAGNRTLVTARTFLGQPWKIHVWDIPSARELQRLEGDKEKLQTVAFGPGARRFAVSTPDLGVRLWKGVAEIRDLPVGVKARCDLLWSDLASADAPRAYRALWSLAETEGAAAFLKQRLQPVTWPGVKNVERLIANLSDSRFAVRQKASSELETLAEFAEPILVKSLRQNLPLEAKRRIEQLLQRLENRPQGLEQVRVLRAIAALEYLGTPDARDVLGRLAQGAPEAHVTRDASAALERLPAK